MKKELSLIIPTYNEAKNIRTIIELIDNTLRNKIDYEIIVSDDDSPDKTWEIAKDLAKQYPVIVLRRKSNKGLSPAVVDAFQFARGKIIGVMDADLSHPPEKIPEFLGSFTDPELEVVWGSRLVPGGAVEDWPVIRKLISEGARAMASNLTGIKDVMSGLFFFRKEILAGAVLKPRGYKIGLEVVVRCKVKKFREVAYVFRNREVGESKLSTKIYLQYLLQLLLLYKFKYFGK